MTENRSGNPSGEAIDRTQQTGDELPGSIQAGRHSGSDMDDPSVDGGVDADQPGTVNSAAGVSTGGTGAGTEPGVNSGLGEEENSDAFVADVYGDERADVDEMTDPLGMGQDES
jgi:hypothetical protein